MNQTLDTKLNSLSEALIEENKEIKMTVEAEIGSLKSEIS